MVIVVAPKLRSLATLIYREAAKMNTRSGGQTNIDNPIIHKSEASSQLADRRWRQGLTDVRVERLSMRDLTAGEWRVSPPLLLIRAPFQPQWSLPTTTSKPPKKDQDINRASHPCHSGRRSNKFALDHLELIGSLMANVVPRRPHGTVLCRRTGPLHRQRMQMRGTAHESGAYKRVRGFSIDITALVAHFSRDLGCSSLTGTFYTLRGVDSRMFGRKKLR